MGAYDLAKEALKRANPRAEFSQQPARLWRGDFPLPKTVVEYFADFGPVNVSIPGYGNPYFLPSLAGLWDHQAGYRYHPKTKKHLPGWDEDWLVVADEGGDPFILSRVSEMILHADHGEGEWTPEPIFRSMAAMASVLAVLGEIVALAGTDLTDDDSVLRLTHRTEARSRIAKTIKSKNEADAALSRLGWA